MNFAGFYLFNFVVYSYDIGMGGIFLFDYNTFLDKN